MSELRKVVSSSRPIIDGGVWVAPSTMFSSRRSGREGESVDDNSNKPSGGTSTDCEVSFLSLSYYHIVFSSSFPPLSGVGARLTLLFTASLASPYLGNPLPLC